MRVVQDFQPDQRGSHQGPPPRPHPPRSAPPLQAAKTKAPHPPSPHHPASRQANAPARKPQPPPDAPFSSLPAPRPARPDATHPPAQHPDSPPWPASAPPPPRSPQALSRSRVPQRQPVPHGSASIASPPARAQSNSLRQSAYAPRHAPAPGFPAAHEESRDCCARRKVRTRPKPAAHAQSHAKNPPLAQSPWQSADQKMDWWKSPQSRTYPPAPPAPKAAQTAPAPRPKVSHSRPLQNFPD